MKRIAFILVGMFFLWQQTAAHNPNEAFFEMVQNTQTFEIEAELPWSLRNALLQFEPRLKNAQSKEDFEKVLVQYLKQKLILKDKKGRVLELLLSKELLHQGHTHQSTFLLVYQGKAQSITNTILFELYPNQKNYHYLVGKEKKNFTTHPQKATFLLEQPAQKTTYSSFNKVGFWLIGLLTCVLLSLTILVRWKKT